MKHGRESGTSVENSSPTTTTRDVTESNPDYHVNLIETEHAAALKRRRKNYRDPENAAKLAMAMDILMRQRKDGKIQDLKQISAHLGLPYNTIRDNYLRLGRASCFLNNRFY